VKEFLALAFGRAGLDWEQYVESDARHIRPAEVDLLLGDASKAKKMLGWEPGVSFQALVEMMVDADLELARREAGVGWRG
jgi:GDPmannose 4,6-dehydratase